MRTDRMPALDLLSQGLDVDQIQRCFDLCGSGGTGVGGAWTAGAGWDPGPSLAGGTELVPPLPVALSGCGGALAGNGTASISLGVSGSSVSSSSSAEIWASVSACLSLIVFRLSATDWSPDWNCCAVSVWIFMNWVSHFGSSGSGGGSGVGGGSGGLASATRVSTVTDPSGVDWVSTVRCSTISGMGRVLRRFLVEEFGLEFLEHGEHVVPIPFPFLDAGFDIGARFLRDEFEQPVEHDDHLLQFGKDRVVGNIVPAHENSSGKIGCQCANLKIDRSCQRRGRNISIGQIWELDRLGEESIAGRGG